MKHSIHYLLGSLICYCSFFSFSFSLPIFFQFCDEVYISARFYVISLHVFRIQMMIFLYVTLSILSNSVHFLSFFNVFSFIIFFFFFLLSLCSAGRPVLLSSQYFWIFSNQHYSISYVCMVWGLPPTSQQCSLYHMFTCLY